MKRKLPLFIERSLGDMHVSRLALASEFEHDIRSEKKISCKSGCAECCYHPVLISVLEGIFLYRWFAEHGRWTPSFRQSLEKFSKTTTGLAFEVWAITHIPCPLLTSKNECSAYEARPLTCRTTFSTGNPHYCHTHRIGPDTGFVNRVEVLSKFHVREVELLKRYNLFHMLFNVGKAMLLAEKVCNGTIDLEDVNQEYVRGLEKTA